MEAQSVGKLLPRVLFPYAQQWAERSGMTLLSRLLEDEQFRALVEKYGEEFVMRAATPPHPFQKENHTGNGHQPTSRHTTVVEADLNDSHLARLLDRVSALEAEYELQQAILEELRTKSRPLAEALGCCPDCFVGIAGCPTCWGRSSVGAYPPDQVLLEEMVVKPLAARGLPLSLDETKASVRARKPAASSVTTKEKKTWQRK